MLLEMGLEGLILDCPPTSMSEVVFVLIIDDLNDLLKQGNVNLLWPLLGKKWNVLRYFCEPFDIVYFCSVFGSSIGLLLEASILLFEGLPG
jgi:hypothetical protein